jgi:hypothetical protein
MVEKSLRGCAGKNRLGNLSRVLRKPLTEYAMPQNCYKVTGDVSGRC